MKCGPLRPNSEPVRPILNPLLLKKDPTPHQAESDLSSLRSSKDWELFHHKHLQMYSNLIRLDRYFFLIIKYIYVVEYLEHNI